MAQALPFRTALAALLIMVADQPAAAVDPVVEADGEEARDSVIVGPGSLAGESGRLAVNVVAGSGNQQVNDAVVAIGGSGISSQSVTQRSAGSAGSNAPAAIALATDSISGNAGLISLNITAGNGNQSANLVQASFFSSGALSDQLLEQTRAPSEPMVDDQSTVQPNQQSLSVSGTALRGNSGLVQLNLVGGERNASANTFQLAVGAGTGP